MSIVPAGLLSKGHRWLWHGVVLVLYATLSWWLLDRGANLTRTVLGYGSDPTSFIWFLAWWPWALAHHISSLTTHLLWQPYGLNLAWTTCIPLLALLAAPITVFYGPLLAFNLLTLAALPLAAWAGYFLYLELCNMPVAAVLGGLFFGFSSFEAAQSLSHLNLDFTVFIPLILLLALRRIRGRSGRGTTALWLGLLLGFEFLVSAESLATTVLFGSIAFVLAWEMALGQRQALRALMLDLLFAAPVALLLASPILAAMIIGPHDFGHPAVWGTQFAIDGLNIFVPTESTWLGGDRFTALSFHFTGLLVEQTGYLGLPFLLLIYVILRDRAARRRLRLPLAMLGIVVLASMGDQLRLGGRDTGVPLPWIILSRLPLLGEALPARCMVYAMLLGGMILSLWVGSARGVQRILFGSLVCLFVLPVPRPPQPSPALVFFQPMRVEAALGKAPRLLILPFGEAGPSSFWQAENGFGFTQVGGYLGYPPTGAQYDPAVMQLFSNTFLQGFAQDFASLCRLDGVQYVVATPRTSAEELRSLALLGWSRRRIDDVVVFIVPNAPHR